MRRRGFTLIEVLATMTLLAIVLPVAMRGVSIALFAADSARHRSEAASIGEAKLNTLISTGEWSVSGASGDFGSDWPGYQWNLQTAQCDFNVTEIVLTVTWTERGQQRSLPVATMVSDTSGTTSTGLGL